MRTSSILVASVVMSIAAVQGSNLRVMVASPPAGEDHFERFGLYWKAVPAKCDSATGPCKMPKKLQDYEYPVYYLSPEHIAEGAEIGCGMEYYHVDQMICTMKAKTDELCCETSWCHSEYRPDGNNTCDDSRACVKISNDQAWMPMTMATSTGAVDQHYCHLAFTRAPADGPTPVPDRSSFKPVAFTPHLAYCSSTDASACSKVSDEYCKRPERGGCLGSAGYTTAILDPSHPDNYRLNTITCLCPPTPKADKPLAPEVGMSVQSRTHGPIKVSSVKPKVAISDKNN